MKTTRIYALLVILIIFGGKAFGQEHEQVLPKSMIKIGINAFLTQEVKSSDTLALMWASAHSFSLLFSTIREIRR